MTMEEVVTFQLDVVLDLRVNLLDKTIIVEDCRVVKDEMRKKSYYKSSVGSGMGF